MISPPEDLLWVEISRSALRHNYDIVRGLLGSGVEMAPCVKANAYGHGRDLVARELVQLGAEWLAVQTFEDALALSCEFPDRKVMVFGPVPARAIPEVVRRRIRVFLSRFEDVELFAAEARKQGVRLPVQVEVDTGMSRYGVLPGELKAVRERIATLPELELEALVTHFASSGGPPYNQLFDDQWRCVEKNLLGADVPLNMAKSSAIVRYGKTHGQIVRPGIMIYGYGGASEINVQLAEQGVPLKHALSFKTRVTLVKDLPPGASIGYDGTYITDRPTKIAVLPLGYADGLSRLLSNRGQVLVRGQRAVIRGRVCMNVTMVDVTDIPGVEYGDEVVLLGSQGECTISADHVASLTQTIPYEVLTSIKESIPRYVVD